LPTKRANAVSIDPAPGKARRPSAPRPAVATKGGRSRGTRTAPPVLVRLNRNGFEDSTHRGHVVETDVDGRLLHVIGDPERVVLLRSTVKPFGVLALIEAGGLEAFDVADAELALLASSHSGEDLHVRTLQDLFRRARVSQTALACGSEGAPLDALTAARLARDGERPSPIRHMCSGAHGVYLLLCRLNDWDPAGYWLEEHPAQRAYQRSVAQAFDIPEAQLATAIDGCGIPTYAVPLRAVAKAFAMLAAPDTLAATDPRRHLAPGLTRIRDAMIAHPELVAGTHDRLDTSLMKAAPGRVVSKAGMEALRGVGVLAGPRTVSGDGPSGLATKIEDGGAGDRATWSVGVEALRQVGVLDAGQLRQLARYHRPVEVDPHGRVIAEAVADFELAPVRELL
jgi:L-asparaginase II